MTAMVKAWSHVALRQALNAWTAFVQTQQEKREMQHRAVLFWNARELAQVDAVAMSLLMSRVMAGVKQLFDMLYDALARVHIFLSLSLAPCDVNHDIQCYLWRSRQSDFVVTLLCSLMHALRCTAVLESVEGWGGVQQGVPSGRGLLHRCSPAQGLQPVARLGL